MVAPPPVGLRMREGEAVVVEGGGRVGLGGVCASVDGDVAPVVVGVVVVVVVEEGLGAAGVAFMGKGWDIGVS